MINVTLYYRKGNAECEQTRKELDSLQEELPHRIIEIDIDSDPSFIKEYGNDVPFVEVGPYRLRPPIDRQNLAVALHAAQDRQDHYEKVEDATYKERYQRGHSFNRSDRFSFWFSNHYMLVFNLVFCLYIGLPVLAPIFMKIGADLPAAIIYKIYSPLCHQLAFRSWFLFGQQAAYPRALAGVHGLMSYEQATGDITDDIQTARAFIGNNQLGYKMAFCERDFAIYGSILLFGLIYSLSGRKLKSLPWYLWIIIGILPIAIDGFSQLPDLMNISFPAWVPMRESTPFLRSLTGFLFGFTTAWFGYPYIEESMLDTRRIFLQRLAVISQLKAKTNS